MHHFFSYFQADHLQFFYLTHFFHLIFLLKIWLYYIIELHFINSHYFMILLIFREKILFHLDLNIFSLRYCSLSIYY
jgi:hypothetical protein